MISSAATGALSAIILQSGHLTPPHIEVFAFTGATRGRIRIAGLPNGQTASVEYAAATAGDHPDALAPKSPGDLEQSRRITDRTIYAVAALLRQGGAG